MKRKRLSLQEREEIWKHYQDANSDSSKFCVQQLARDYQVSRPTIYAILEKNHISELDDRKWLSSSDTDEIRRRYYEQQNGNFVIARIAREYGVSRTTIYGVLAMTMMQRYE
jgi:Mor family transcriptional regulator